MTYIRSKIIGHGHFAPAKVLTNDDMAKLVETSDEWITTRTGIKTRCIAEKDETTSFLAYKASEMALENAKLNAQDIDLIILATITPDYTTPASAVKVAQLLGTRAGIPAFDISAACSGFVYALTLADNMIRLGQVKNALIIGAETLSKITDWTDRNTCVLFGDGAGALVLKATEGIGTKDDFGVLATSIHADANYCDNLRTNGGVSTSQTAGFLTMDGREVFKFAIGAMADAAEEVMSKVGIEADEINWIIPHQANVRIIDSVAKKLNMDTSKVVINLDKHGNTSAASIPLALSEALSKGTIKSGDVVVLTAMGAGFTSGGAIIRI